jgi:hypothetical protein
VLRFSLPLTAALTLPLAALAALSGLGGCSSTKLPPTSTAGGDGAGMNPGAGGGGNTEDGGGTCAFATTATSFALPSLALTPTPAFTQLQNQLKCTAGPGSQFNYLLADMNRDGQPDLVVTAACDDATVGVSAWLVYANTGDGFATTALRYPLPPASPPTPANCATTTLFDINGDLYLDTVVTTLCTDATVGSSKWLVYAGSAAGFSQTATPYALPPTYATGTFTATAKAGACSTTANTTGFTVVDLTGDGISDVVVTQTCTDTTVGTSVWLLYAGSSSGVAQTPVRFPLPTTPTVSTGAFVTPSATASCTTGVTRPTYELADLDLDGKLDFVVTAVCSSAGEPTVGTSTWLWYPNAKGQGFAATATSFALPALTGLPASSFNALSAIGTCTNGSGTPSYFLTDVNGDTKLDLVVTRDCADALTGVSYWELFTNTGTGFSDPRRTLTLPAALGGTTAAPVGLSGASVCTAPLRPAFTTSFLAGNRLNFVVTGVCNDSTVGESRWLVYPATCQ